MRKTRFILFSYFTIEVVPFVVIAFLMLTTLILAQQVGRQPEIISLSASLSLTAKALSYLLPNVAIITLPFALLIGTIVGLNRLSADSEIIAAKGSGLSLLKLATPLFALGIAATMASLLLTHYVSPWSIKQLRLTRDHLIRETLGQNIKPHTFSNYFPNYLIYIQEIDHVSGDWLGVFILNKDSTQATRLFTANRGEIRITDPPIPSIEIQLSQGLSLETFSNAANNQNLAFFNKLTIKLSNLGNAATNTTFQESHLSVQEMPTYQLTDRMADQAQPKEMIQAAIEYHKRFALPFACLILVAIGTTVGVRASRYSGRAAGGALGFSVAITYYLILIAGQNLAISRTLAPAAGIWLANVICLVGIGAISISSRALIYPYRIAPRTAHPYSSPLIPSKPPKLMYNRNRTHITSLINYILISELTKYFVLSLGCLVVISIIFTLFDLLPAMVRNNVSTQYTFIYLSYLTPQITYYVAPFALLVSVLTTYNILSRTNQLTALVAGGQGHLALSLPSLSAVALLIILLFTLSESVLPSTNREQDYRYHHIKGRQIEQAAIAFGQKWVYGLNHTIYSYQYRDNLLLNTTAYHLDPSQYFLREITYAQAAIQTDPQTWSVSSGHRYEILNHQLSIVPSSPSHQLTLNIPEGHALFRRTTNEASKMKLSELRDYLQHLALIGASTTDLRIELEKKKAFPFTCLTLVALALPFALANTRRSAFAGFGLSIGFSLAFWSATALLEAAGKRSLLPVWMAAWGAQALFLTLAAYLLSRRRF